MNGWGWSYRNGQVAAVPPPFTLEAVLTENHGLKNALGQLDQTAHPLASMWVFLSPIIAVNEWRLSHLCAFHEQPQMPIDSIEIFDDEKKVDILSKVIDGADITGFARVEIDPAPEYRLPGS